MFVPTVSVSLIGLLVGLAFWVASGRMVGSVVAGVVGAWAGFLVGGTFGVVLDVLQRDGSQVVVLGHLGAAVAAIVIAVWERRLADREQMADPRSRVETVLRSAPEREPSC